MPGPDEKIKLCDPYVWEDPRYLFRHVWFGTPKASCASEYVNQAIFVYISALLVGFLVNSVTGFSAAIWVTLLIATVYLIPTFFALRAIESFRLDITRDASGNDTGLPKKVSEGFVERRDDMNGVYRSSSTMNEKLASEENPCTLAFQNETLPGVRNPFANVTLDELPDGHTTPNLAPFHKGSRKAAPDITSVQRKVDLDAFFRVNWYNDPTDVFGKTQSQRIFISAPSTTIPNDQGSYQDWLYKIPGKTCKEGNPAACYGGTEGAMIPWLNND